MSNSEAGFQRCFDLCLEADAPDIPGPPHPQERDDDKLFLQFLREPLERCYFWVLLKDEKALRWCDGFRFLSNTVRSSSRHTAVRRLAMQVCLLREMSRVANTARGDVVASFTAHSCGEANCDGADSHIELLRHLSRATSPRGRCGRSLFLGLVDASRAPEALSLLGLSSEESALDEAATQRARGGLGRKLNSAVFSFPAEDLPENDEELLRESQWYERLRMLLLQCRDGGEMEAAEIVAALRALVGDAGAFRVRAFLPVVAYQLGSLSDRSQKVVDLQQLFIAGGDGGSALKHDLQLDGNPRELAWIRTLGGAIVEGLELYEWPEVVASQL